MEPDPLLNLPHFSDELIATSCQPTSAQV